MLGYRHWRNAIVHRPYFFISLLLTAVLFVVLALATDWQGSTRLLLAWNVSVWLYLLFTLPKLWRTSSSHILRRAQEQDLGKWIIVFNMIVGRVGMVAFVLAFMKQPSKSPIRYPETRLPLS